jgi:hypothetical protein
MRISFAGSIVFPNPIVLVYNADAIFVKADFIALGYKYFEVIAIGGGGGRGGNYFGVDFNTPDHTLRIYGGMGGGGGFRRIRGVLSALPESTNVVVGGAGVDGTDLLTDALVEYDIPTTDGGDGGNSHFNNPACIASGGEGGKRVYSATEDVDTNANGGDGGAGNSSASGGGGVGSIAGTTSTSSEPAGDGRLVGTIGKGGGGGAGGLGIVDFAMRIPATPGGKGAYDSSDQSVFDIGGDVVEDPDSEFSIVPGFGGGARVTPLNGSNKPYGRSGLAGVVVLRLTVDG